MLLFLIILLNRQLNVIIFWEKNERNRLSLESKAKKRKIDKESVESELLAAGIESMNTNDAVAAADTAMDTNDAVAAASTSIQTKFPDPIRPLAPFNQSRMNTVIIYGWKPY